MLPQTCFQALRLCLTQASKQWHRQLYTLLSFETATCGIASTGNAAGTAAPARHAAFRQLGSRSGGYEPSTSYALPSDYDERAMFKQSIPQQRFAARVETALLAAVHSDAQLRANLVERHGLAIDRLRVSEDRRTAFVLWSCAAGREEACKRDVERNAFRIRRAIGNNLGAKHTPRIEFRHNRLPENRAGVVAALQNAERETITQATSAEAADGDELARRIEAAVGQLQANMRVRPRRGKRPAAADAATGESQQVSADATGNQVAPSTLESKAGDAESAPSA